VCGCGGAARRAFTARVGPIKGRRARAFASSGMLLITVRTIIIIIIINNNNNGNRNRSKRAHARKTVSPWYLQRVWCRRKDGDVGSNSDVGVGLWDEQWHTGIAQKRKRRRVVVCEWWR